VSRWNDQLIGDLSPGDVAADQRAAAIAGVSGCLQRIVACYADAQAASHAAATGSAGVKVAVSRTPPIPINVDRVDLTGPANAGSIGVLETSPWREDQIGHIAVASELDFWACDWASRRNEQPPAPQVPELCAWLDVRLELMYDEFPAWDEMATKLDRVARALYGTLSPKRVRSVPLSAPCSREGCEGVLGRREDGWVECGCGRILSASEYDDWAISVIHREANGGWGITAKEIQLVTTWPAGAIRRYLVEYGITRTGPEQRPTLYSREEWHVAYPKIEAKRQARAEREARAA
jgi:hypothetical protein